MYEITITEIFLLPLYILAIYLISMFFKARGIRNNPNFDYTFFTTGLIIKMVFAIIFSLVYVYYYNGGDTILYFKSSVSLGKLLFVSPKHFFSLLSGDMSPDNFSAFNINTDFPNYRRDFRSFSVVRYTFIFSILGARYLLTTAVIISSISYIGIWKLYMFFTLNYPKLSRQFAFIFLFLPSFLFWSSGIMKETFIIFALGIFVYSIYKIMVQKEVKILYVIGIILSIYIMVTIKAYVFFAIIISILIWTTINKLRIIKSLSLRVIVFPLLFLIIWIPGIVFMYIINENTSNNFLDIEKVSERASLFHQGIIFESKGKNIVDIGEVNKDIVLQNPKALISGLFRPFIWETSGLLMFIFSAENLLVLLMFIFVLFLGPIHIFKSFVNSPLLVLISIYTLTLGYFVGITASNYGVLVRFKIPYIPFFIAGLMIVFHKYLYSNRNTDKEL